MKRKYLITTIAAMAMATSMSITAFAAGWQQNTTGWWYATDDAGTQWHANGWQWIDGDSDGVAECYYFDGNGYILTSTTTPDGYRVNSNGAWIVDNVIQKQGTVVDNTTGNGDIALNSDNGGYNSYGCSNAALDMINNSREENVKYGEISTDVGTLTTAVIYANGFAVVYPNGVSSYKTVSVVRARKDLDGRHLFKYYDSSLDADQAARMLQNKGFPDGIKGAYSDRSTCWVEVGEGTLNWGRTFIILRE